ncbi:MAG: monofunctional biosynthetic peptidoglycan transglycosylase [Alphaproteobacteria bacterium]|nr:monofunctional biosynthetic peptidoglycan transglycosylase [Alphaproteobacteria bacterium]
MRVTRRKLLIGIPAVLIGLPVLLILIYGVVPVPVTPLMLMRDAPIEKDWVSIDNIAPALQHAVIVSEDQRFCTHSGIDWTEMSKVLDELQETGEASRGASTITMQVVKNLYLWPSRSRVRKAIEIPLAVMMDFLLTKRRILELYLNIAEWGDGIYGAEAAAQRHFNVSAKALTRQQAARLVAVLPNPLERDPARPSNAVQSRANKIANDLYRAPATLWDCL